MDHKPGAVAAFLREFDPGSPVAVESLGNRYWIVDEIEAAGMIPRLVHPRKAKLTRFVTLIATPLRDNLMPRSTAKR